MNQHPFFNHKDQVLSFQKPARYTGGEWGSIPRNQNKSFKIALCFPDLYEIGMSNSAIRILYHYWNSISDVQCERFFSPFGDMEEWIRKTGNKLTSLESGIPLSDFDVIAFTIGYELSLTNIFNILELGGLRIRRNERSDSDPLVICGGPAATNPYPLEDFIDAIFIGEAEPVIQELTQELMRIKKCGDNKSQWIEGLRSRSFIHVSSADKKTLKATWLDFGKQFVQPDWFPVPSLEVVQGHGVIEIMRGCPNRCRFCHAGYFYRPMRLKAIDVILNEADYLVHQCGYREITLTSLSSGDYPDIASLVRTLNARYSPLKVSFALPSLRVDSLTLPLLSELSAIRKSGLTFAVETPLDSEQRSINKIVPEDKIITILKEAKAQGWKSAKFYFMIGLPGQNSESIALSISDYLKRIQKSSGLQINANVNIFNPKPHTPFFETRQLGDEEGFALFREIKSGVSDNRKVKITYHSSFLSLLEGLLSRGDRRVGELFYNGYLRGARFDAWNDLCRFDIWKDLVKENEGLVLETLDSDKVDLLKDGYWGGISFGVHKNHLSRERDKALSGQLTEPCSEGCSEPCGVCGVQNYSVSRTALSVSDYSTVNSVVTQTHFRPVKFIFHFKKDQSAIALGHLDVLGVFEKAFQRAGVYYKFSEGYNPIPQFEIASPLPVGYQGNDEIGSVILMVNESDDIEKYGEELVIRINKCFPEGFTIHTIQKADSHWDHKKLMGEYWGSSYTITVNSLKRNPEELKVNINRVILEKKASEFYSIKESQHPIEIIAREFDAPIGLQKILKIVGEIEGTHFLNGLGVTRLQLMRRDPEDRNNTLNY